MKKVLSAFKTRSGSKAAPSPDRQENGGDPQQASPLVPKRLLTSSMPASVKRPASRLGPRGAEDAGPSAVCARRGSPACLPACLLGLPLLLAAAPERTAGSLNVRPPRRRSRRSGAACRARAAA